MPAKKLKAPAKRSSARVAQPAEGADLHPPRVTVFMYRAVGRAADMANSEVRKFGLNIKGMRVLITLLERKVMRVGNLSELVAVDQSTLSHLLRRLEADGHLKRTRPAVDNRSVDVVLTPKGQRLAEKCLDISLRLESVLLQGFTASEVAVLRNQLWRMCENAERELPPPRGTAIT